ncbi:MAG: BatA and WFA domain-containing protein [Gammaproteobacteria bacterium]
MSLLAPLFLLGLAAIALPVWLHRLQTQSPERRPFSSTMLLEQSTQQTHLQKQLRYLVLLALRIALLLLVVLAFSKPLLERSSTFLAGDDAVLHLIVIDTSFSMGYGDWFENARSQAEQLVNGMSDNDLAQLIAAGDTMEIMGNPDNDRAGLLSQIRSLEPGASRLDLGVLISNLNALLREQPQNTVIHIISDFQTSGLPARFADLIPGSNGNYIAGLELHPVAGGDASNVFVDSIIRTDSGLDVGVRGYNNESVEVRLALNLNDELQEEQAGIIPASGQRVFQFQINSYENGDNRVEASLLEDDALPADNIRYAVVDNTPARPVLLITANVDGLPVRYLTAAVEAGQQGYRVEAVSVNELDPRIIQRYPWLIIDDLGIVNESLAAVISEYIAGGGAVFTAAGERAQQRQRLPVTGFPVNPVISGSGLLSPHAVARIDTSHPVLAGTSGWRDIYVSQLLSVDTSATSQDLINLDNAAPLLIEHTIGRGRLLLLTSSLDNKWNDLPIRPVFVNFMAEAARYLSGSERIQRHQTIGDFLQLGQSGNSAGQVIDPEGNTVLSLADTHRSQDIKLNQTGIYEIYTDDSEILIAVNPDLRESELAVMSADELAKWKDAVPVHAPGTNPGLTDIEHDPVELWHILLILLGLVLLAESILGNRYLASGKGYV